MNSSIRSWSSRARSDGGGSTVLMGPTYPLRPGSGARDLPEVPADDLVRDHLQPGVPAVRRVRVDAGVLAGEQPLRLDQLGHVGVAAPEISTPRSSPYVSPVSMTTPTRGSRVRSVQRWLRTSEVSQSARPSQANQSGTTCGRPSAPTVATRQVRSA